MRYRRCRKAAYSEPTSRRIQTTGSESPFLIQGWGCLRIRLSICLSPFLQLQAGPAWDCQLFIKSSVIMVVQSTYAALRDKEPPLRLSCRHLRHLRKEARSQRSKYTQQTN